DAGNRRGRAGRREIASGGRVFPRWIRVGKPLRNRRLPRMGFRGSRVDSSRRAPATSHPNPRGRGEVDGVRVGVTTCYFGGFAHSQVPPEDALTSRDTTFGSTCCCAARAPHSGALPDCATSRDL